MISAKLKNIKEYSKMPNKKCTVPGCENKRYRKGRTIRAICNKCFSRKSRHGDYLTLKKSNGTFCSLWQYRNGSKMYWATRIRGRGDMSVHRLVMEHFLGRSLKSNEIVHHIDGDGLNNRRSNLQVMDSVSDHVRLEIAERRSKPDEDIF